MESLQELWKALARKVLGREGTDGTSAGSEYAQAAAAILKGVGGRENVASIDNCITRLRLVIKDEAKMDEEKIASAGVAGIVRPGKNAVQMIIGVKAPYVAEEFKKLCQPDVPV